MTDTKENTNTDSTYKLPNLVLTPFFENGSSWPSYHIKPIYNSDPSVENYPLYTAYYNTANNIANTIQSQSHTSHTNNSQTQMYPVMPYYIPAQKVGEVVPPVITPPYNNLRQQQLWYYQQYIPQMHNISC